MKLGFSSLAVGLAAVQAVNAHYVFDALIINGAVSNGWQYVRKNSNGIQPTKQFITPSDDFRCNSGSFSTAGSTQVATVAPGTRLGFRLWNGGTIIHPGPITIHMSKAPGDVRQYRGDGDWFKVYQNIICDNSNNGLQDTDWCSWHKPSFEFTLPNDTPPGQYLVRVEHIALHGAQSANTEFYFTCAQINVTGNGRGTPGPLVKIPGLYNSNDPALRFFIYGAARYPYANVGSHSVWTGGGSTGGGSTGGGSTGGTVAIYGQCGGIGHTGSTTCASGSTCKVSNAYYSQCLP